MNSQPYKEQHCTTEQPYNIDKPFSWLLFILNIVDHFFFDYSRLRLHC